MNTENTMNSLRIVQLTAALGLALITAVCVLTASPWVLVTVLVAITAQVVATRVADYRDYRAETAEDQNTNPTTIED